MSNELMQALQAWGLAIENCQRLADNQEQPVERKKPDDTEGGDCD